MNRIKKNLLIQLKELKYSSYQPKFDWVFLENFPYFAQVESPEIITQLWKKDFNPDDDPKWQQSGAKTKLDYLNWTNNDCGMACLKMILAYKYKKVYPIVDLAIECTKYGGYVINPELYQKGDYLKSIGGLYYAPFIKFIKDKFNLDGKILSPMVLPEIVQALDNDKIAIVSVNSAIKEPGSPPPFKGGHLVLMVGYSWDKKMLYLHNPAGLFKKSQEYAEISFLDFKKFFDNKGMVINLKVPSSVQT